MALHNKSDSIRRSSRRRDGAGVRGDFLKGLVKDAMADAHAASDALTAAEGKKSRGGNKKRKVEDAKVDDEATNKKPKTAEAPINKPKNYGTYFDWYQCASFCDESHCGCGYGCNKVHEEEVVPQVQTP